MLKFTMKKLEQLKAFLDGIATVSVDTDDNYVSVISCQDDASYIFEFNCFKFPEDDDPNFGRAVYFYRDDCFVGQILYDK